MENMCRFPGCNKTYCYDGKARRDCQASHGLVVESSKRTTNKESSPKSSDDMFSYQCSFLEYAVLVRNFQDAVLEGDGDRLIRCWKFSLLYLKNDGSTS